MSDIDGPTTQYREIVVEWWESWKEMCNGWQFWFILLSLQTIKMVMAYTKTVGIEPEPLWFSGLIYTVCLYYFIDGWDR